MSMIEAVHDFINTYAPLAQDRIDVDFLPAEAGGYSLETTPCAEWVKRYVDGSGLRQFQFVLASREFFDETIRTQLEHIGFYENFSVWLDEQTLQKHFPELPDGCTAVKIQAVSCGYAMEQGANTARYQIQCKLLYRQERT